MLQTRIDYGHGESMLNTIQQIIKKIETFRLQKRENLDNWSLFQVSQYNGYQIYL